MEREKRELHFPNAAIPLWMPRSGAALSFAPSQRSKELMPCLAELIAQNASIRAILGQGRFKVLSVVESNTAKGAAYQRGQQPNFRDPIHANFPFETIKAGQTCDQAAECALMEELRLKKSIAKALLADREHSFALPHPRQPKWKVYVAILTPEMCDKLGIRCAAAVPGRLERLQALFTSAMRVAHQSSTPLADDESPASRFSRFAREYTPVLYPTLEQSAKEEVVAKLAALLLHFHPLGMNKFWKPNAFLLSSSPQTEPRLRHAVMELPFNMHKDGFSHEPALTLAFLFLLKSPERLNQQRCMTLCNLLFI